MGCQVLKSSATLEAVSLKWGVGHTRKIYLGGNTGNVLAGKYLPINYHNEELEETLGYVWFDDGVASDPAPVGRTLIGAVSVADGDDGDVIAAAFKAVTDAYTFTGYDGISNRRAFKPAVLTLDGMGATVCLENRFIGKITPETDEDSIGVSVGITVENEGVGVDLGSSSDAISLSSEVQSVDILSNQSGALILDQILQGETASITGNFIEITKERFDALKGAVTGTAYDLGTTVGGGFDNFTGSGEGSLYRSLLEKGGMLIMHPIRVPKGNYYSDVVFWRSAPKIQEETFDGTAARGVTIEFTAYIDSSKKAEINLYGRGDWTNPELDA